MQVLYCSTATRSSVYYLLIDFLMMHCGNWINYVVIHLTESIVVLIPWVLGIYMDIYIYIYIYIYHDTANNNDLLMVEWKPSHFMISQSSLIMSGSLYYTMVCTSTTRAVVVLLTSGVLTKSKLPQISWS